MNQHVIEKAKELAAAIAMSPEYIALRMAEDAVTQDDEVTEFYAQYAEKQAELEALTCQDTPDFDKMGALTNELNAIKEKVQAAPSAKNAQVARQNFNMMMRQVNAELQQTLAPGEGSSCSGNCSSCGSSCGHKH